MEILASAAPARRGGPVNGGFKLSLDIYQIAEAFSSHRFAVTYPYMADEIK